MGTLLDTTVFIDLEPAVRRLPPGNAMAEAGRRLEEQLGSDEEVGIAGITASELLHGVRRATPGRRARREAFVEAVLDAFPPLPFGLIAARAHARIWAGLVFLIRPILMAAGSSPRERRRSPAPLRQLSPAARAQRP